MVSVFTTRSQDAFGWTHSHIPDSNECSSVCLTYGLSYGEDRGPDPETFSGEKTTSLPGSG